MSLQDRTKVVITTAPIWEESNYQKLLERCKPLVNESKRIAQDFIKLNWQLGKELLEIPRQYGASTILSLARDLKVSQSHLYQCLRFAQLYPTLEEVENRFSKTYWRSVVRDILYQPTATDSTIERENALINQFTGDHPTHIVCPFCHKEFDLRREEAIIR